MDCEGTFGAGLLPAAWGDGKDEVVLAVNAAYAKIGDNPRANLGLWRGVTEIIAQRVEKRYADVGLTAAKLYDWDFRLRLRPASPDADANAHAELVRALLTPINDVVSQHIRDRLSTEGNLHFSFSGATGMAKSSCSIALADWTKRIDAARITDHLAIDLGDVAMKLTDKKPGDTVILDEVLATGGAGSKTQESQAANVEDTLRSSGVGLYRNTPEGYVGATTQAKFEAFAWNRERRFTAFLVWLRDRPVGVVAFPWCRRELWDAYKPWKKENEERTRAAHFKDNRVVLRAAKALVERQDFVSFVVSGSNKPTKTDLALAVELFNRSILSTVHTDAVVNLVYTWSYSLRRLDTNFPALFGFTPGDGLKRLAARCTSK